MNHPETGLGDPQDQSGFPHILVLYPQAPSCRNVGETRAPGYDNEEPRPKYKLTMIRVCLTSKTLAHWAPTELSITPAAEGDDPWGREEE